MASNTISRPHKCRMCGKAFARSNAQTRHEASGCAFGTMGMNLQGGIAILSADAPQSVRDNLTALGFVNTGGNRFQRF